MFLFQVVATAADTLGDVARNALFLARHELTPRLTKIADIHHILLPGEETRFVAGGEDIVIDRKRGTFRFVVNMTIVSREVFRTEALLLSQPIRVGA